MDCSIIICTRNRGLSLEKTLLAFQSVKVPPGWQVEMIVADNGSTDHTAEVIRSATHAAIEIHSVYELRPGKSRAQNVAVAQARGTALLFTDDDVEPADNWLENMARPLLENRFDAVAGRILLAEDLRRPWFSHLHGIWLAEVREPKVQLNTSGLVGASMGIRRDVFDRIGYFDEELGPGATGFGEETLVWLQMKEAGMRVCPVNDTFLIHRPDPSRLLRSSWLASAKRFGSTRAYLMHHWEYAHVPYPELRALWTQIKLLLRRLLRRPVRIDGEGCPDWEMSYLVRIEAMKQFVKESRRPRNYELRALRGRCPISHP